ncbi:MAG TPA: group III truncated hemoglobin [Bacteroidia bacterium]|nr:group III truncated hemoglobin [Bacteroidia bacterium]
MKKDIQSKADIKILIDSFYEKVKTDDTIGYLFTNVVHVDWEKHLPIMVNFWDNILFYTGNYRGQPMNLHHHLHQLSNLTLEHFARWNKLFDSTVDALFEGENAERAKQNAHSISTVMQLKILKKHNPL